jgi:hypothetical protein
VTLPERGSPAVATPAVPPALAVTGGIDSDGSSPSRRIRASGVDILEAYLGKMTVHEAHLDQGAMWPIASALKDATAPG